MNVFRSAEEAVVWLEMVRDIQNLNRVCEQAIRRVSDTKALGFSDEAMDQVKKLGMLEVDQATRQFIEKYRDLPREAEIDGCGASET